MASRFYRFQSKYAPYLFVAPFLVIFGSFGLYPLLKSVYLSLFITSGPDAKVFVGLANFWWLLTDPDFHKAAANTAIFAAASVCIQLPLSLGLALLLNSRLVVLRNAFRLFIFSPRLVGMVFAGVLFTLVLNGTQDGLLNTGLNSLFSVLPWLEDVLNRLLGTTWPYDWLGNAELVMPALILTAMWMYVGFNMIYFLAALQAVDRNLYEAAMVDGAGPVRKFLHVTLPGIKPVAVFVVVLSTIGSFQLFELPYVMLDNTAGPDNAGLTVVMYLYQNGFVSGDLGYASAIGWSLALGVLLLSLVQVRLSGTMKKEA